MMDDAQEYDERLRWWRVHCIAVAVFVAVLVGAALVKHEATALPIGLVLALAAFASAKAGRTFLPRGRGLLSRESEAADFPDGDAVDGESGATLIVLVWVGFGLAAYGAYALVRLVLTGP